MDKNTTVSKDTIREYIDKKPHFRVEEKGRHYVCRIGERSHLDGIYTTRLKAELSLINHVGNVILMEQKRVAKRKEANAKKSKS